MTPFTGLQNLLTNFVIQYVRGVKSLLRSLRGPSLHRSGFSVFKILSRSEISTEFSFMYD